MTGEEKTRPSVADWAPTKSGSEKTRTDFKTFCARLDPIRSDETMARSVLGAVAENKAFLLLRMVIR